MCLGWPLLAVAWCLFLAVAARADDASKAAVINELFEVMHVDALRQQAMQQGLVAQQAQLEKVEPFKSNKAASDELVKRLTQLLIDKLTWDKLKPTMTKLYADNFTEEELSAALTFYKTPAGQAMLTKLPKVLAESMAIGRQEVSGLTPDIRRIVQDVMAEYPASKSSPAHD